MSRHVIETVTFKLTDGMSRERFLQAANGASAFVVAQPGFVRRRLSSADDGTWIEHIEWANLEDAMAAASAIGKDERARAFVSAIDGPSVAMGHSVLEVSIG